MEMSETTSNLHPYTILGGGEGDQVHGKKLIVDRHDFLFPLKSTEQRFLALPEPNQRLYYARLWGGEFRERHVHEPSPTQNECPIKMLFVQGLGGTHANWMDQLEYFSSFPDFDVVALDSRGVGFSTTPTGRWRTSDMAQDIIDLIAHLQWTQGVHLVGFSLGGMIALEASSMAPELFLSTTLISTHAGGVLGTVLPPWGIPPFLKTFSSLESVAAVDCGMELLHSKSFLDEPIVVDHERETVLVQAAHRTGTKVVTNRFKTALALIQQARKYFESENQGDYPEIRILGTLKQMLAAITHYVDWDRLDVLRRESGISFLVMGGKEDNLVNYLNQFLLAHALRAPLLLKEKSGHGVNLHFKEEVNARLLEQVKASRNEKSSSVVDRPRPRRPRRMHPWLMASLAWILIRVFVATRVVVRGSGLMRNALTTVLVAMGIRSAYGPLWKW